MFLRRETGVFALAVFAAACVGRGAPNDAGAGSPSGGRGEPAAGSGERLKGRILVSAAASLTDAFAEIGAAFEAAYPDAEVVLNLAGSSSLATQIIEGAPADVFASADVANMARLVAARQVSGEPRVFARNRLRIAVPAGNPAGVRGLAAFADEALRIGLCAAEVPCGALARRVLEQAGIRPSPDTNEPNVRALLTKIELGELDAGITYATDVTSARGAVEGIEIPDDVNVVPEYPIAVLTGAPNPDAGRAFVRFVLSEEGRVILARRGFAAP